MIYLRKKHAMGAQILSSGCLFSKVSIILDQHVWNMNDLAVNDGDAASTETSQSSEYKSLAEFLSMGILTVADLRGRPLTWSGGRNHQFHF